MTWRSSYITVLPRVAPPRGGPPPGVAPARAAAGGARLGVSGRRPTLTSPAGTKRARPGRSAGRAPTTGATRSGSRTVAAHDAPEAEMTRRGVDRLGLARCGPVAQAVVRGAEVRSALDHPARTALAVQGGRG